MGAGPGPPAARPPRRGPATPATPATLRRREGCWKDCQRESPGRCEVGVRRPGGAPAPVAGRRQAAGSSSQPERVKRKASTVRGRKDLWLWSEASGWPLSSAREDARQRLDRCTTQRVARRACRRCSGRGVAHQKSCTSSVRSGCAAGSTTSLLRTCTRACARFDRSGGRVEEAPRQAQVPATAMWPPHHCEVVVKGEVVRQRVEVGEQARRRHHQRS